jgi:uncharacterized protein YwgA
MKGRLIMNIGHLILAVMGYSKDSTIQGRTLLQKTTYFITEKLNQQVDFAPHYYGPYSEAVAQATDGLVAVGLLTETVEKFPPSDPSANFDARRFTYELNEAGKKVLSELEKGKNGEEFKQIKNLVEEMQKLAGGDYKYLSVAAKMHHILKRHKKAISAKEISKEAKVLGWTLSEEDIKGVIDFLRKMGLATVVREIKLGSS